jgi:succinyl-CoA synthetase alpha subunit
MQAALRYFRPQLEVKYGLLRQMGHAGTIVGGAEDTAAAKMAIMRECGIHVVDSPAEIGDTMLEVLGAK